MLAAQLLAIPHRINQPVPDEMKRLKQQIVAQPHSKRPKRNATGLPHLLKAGLESLSGHSLDDVQVHYNSNKPAQLQAQAYAQGTAIELAPGQPIHSAHEAWHVVQAHQGRVKPTSASSKMVPSDASTLEQEADILGLKAASLLPRAVRPRITRR